MVDPMPQRVALCFRAQRDADELLLDLSAVCFADPHLWIAGDEVNGRHNTIERLTWNPDRRVFDEHVRFRVDDFLALPDHADEEIDIEGLAAGGGYLWLTGSHSLSLRRPRPEAPEGIIDALRFDAARARRNRGVLGRIPLEGGELLRRRGDRQAAMLRFKGEGKRHSNSLLRALIDDPHVGAYLEAEIPSKANGFDVEGLELLDDGRLLLGLRGPVLLRYAMILELRPQETELTDELSLAPFAVDGARYRKHFVDLQGRGVRDLCRDGDDLVILSGPTMDLDAPAGLHRWPWMQALASERPHTPTLLREIPSSPAGHGLDHAEGLTKVVLDGVAHWLVIYDSPDPTRVSKDGDPITVSGDLFPC
jgi:Protein of unknown function (DUF3616)